MYEKTRFYYNILLRVAILLRLRANDAEIRLTTTYLKSLNKSEFLVTQLVRAQL
jgi:hypothetical protein